MNSYMLASDEFRLGIWAGAVVIVLVGVRLIMWFQNKRAKTDDGI